MSRNYFIKDFKADFNVITLRKNSYVLGALVRKAFKAQYRNSVLGILWTLLNPLLNMLVLAFVFTSFFGGRKDVGIYPVYLLTGNIFFGIIRQTTSQSLWTIVNNAGLIKKVKVSYAVFPLSHMFSALINFGFAFLALIIVMLVVGQQFYWSIFLTVTIIPAIFIFSLGLGYVLCSLYVFFRDIRHIYEVFLVLWMYLTPIFYSPAMITDKIASTVIRTNPATHFITMFRSVIQWGNIPSGTEYLIAYAWAFGMLFLGGLIFRLTKRKFILYI